MSAIILSIHPQWAELIYSGVKSYELRRTAPKKLITEVQISKQRRGFARYHRHYTSNPPVYLCETGTGGLITGRFVLGNIYGVEMSDMKKRTMNNVVKHSCVQQEDILKYYKDALTMYVWIVHNAKRYETPYHISDFGLTRVPQGWGYVNIGK